jgi:hypothetical protein
VARGNVQVAFQQEVAPVQQANLGAGRVWANARAPRGIRWRNMNELAGKPCSSTTAGAPAGPASR